MHRSDMAFAQVWQCGLHVAVSGVKAASSSRYRALNPRLTGLKASPLCHAVHVDRAQALRYQLLWVITA